MEELELLIPSQTVREYVSKTGWTFTDFQKAALICHRGLLVKDEYSFFPESVLDDVIHMHSKRYRVASKIEQGGYGYIQKEFNLSDSRCNKIMRIFLDKLKSDDSAVAYTALEKIRRFLRAI